MFPLFSGGDLFIIIRPYKGVAVSVRYRGVEIGNVFLKNVGSDLVVQSSCQELSVQLVALYHLGLPPGVWVFKGVRQGRLSLLLLLLLLLL